MSKNIDFSIFVINGHGLEITILLWVHDNKSLRSSYLLGHRPAS